MAKANKPPKPTKPGDGGGTTNPIPPVTGLIASLTPENKVRLQWDALTGATTYWIRRIGPDGKEYTIAIIMDIIYTDRLALEKTSYTYTISAVVGDALGPRSSPVTITTN